MLFNSYIFIFCFLPAAFIIVWYAKRLSGNGAAELMLILASAVFYSWAGLYNLVLLISLVLLNYAAAWHLMRTPPAASGERNAMLAAGIVLNVVVLGYFKYRGFVLENLGLAAAGTAQRIIIPLAISFFTFQKIAFLVECWRGEIQACSFRRYLMFVSFFPQLIAGPIVRFKEVGWQFDDIMPAGETMRNVAIGATLFVIGLFKKLVIADGLGVEVDKLFPAIAAGTTTGALPAWWAALLYTFQLYFDFSGYSDMALGLARMFGIKLPLNFFSPYRATSIVDFWRRWHITLSRFLRDFLYVPLGGNRLGPRRRYLNLMVTMLIGGLWHGAGWTFVFWGALHGLYLCVNHLWRALPLSAIVQRLPGSGLFFWGLTFVSVVIAWVFFRAPTFTDAVVILRNMVAGGATSAGFSASPYVVFLFLLASWTVFVMPNAYQWLRDQEPAEHFENRPEEIWPFVRFLRWKPTVGSLFVIVIMAYWAIASLDENREFIYFRF